MPKFDIETFARVTNQGGNLATALGTSYGVPSCILNLGNELLNLLPSNLLGGMRSAVAVGRGNADAVVKALSIKLRQLTGIIEFDTEDGIFRFVSNSSKLGNDTGGLLSIISSFVSFTQSAASFGAQLYSNYQTTQAQINSLSSCLTNFEEYLKFTGGESANERANLSPQDFKELIGTEYASEIQQAQDAVDFMEQADDMVARIDNILAARIADPSLEPTREEEAEVVEEIFRLEAGPPQSKQGKFVLSVDGLYYDSQSEGLVPVLLELERRNALRRKDTTWKLEHDPCLGGRGVPTSVESFDTYFNTILDPNIIDDSTYLKQYYDQDNLLQNILGQRHRKIFDVSSNIQELVNSNGSEAIISNLRQVMISEASQFTEKANKRKKQIELAVKMPNIYGRGQVYEPGDIPVNDFSYLEGINFLVDIEKQRSLVLDQADVDEVVLPIETKFTQQIETENPVVLNHLLIANIPDGVTIDDAPASSAPSISVNDTITETGLFALYNYLTVRDSETSGVDYKLFNSSEQGVQNNAQLVGNISSVFDIGLGIAYLEGVAMPSATNQETMERTGSYIKLPPQTPFQDFLYTRSGGTFETWVHVPSLDSQNYGFNIADDVSGLYRLILANENVGIAPNTSSQGDILNMSLENGSTVARGMIFGFTRDRRWTQNEAPSNSDNDNSINNLSIVLAPTQSYDSSSAGFIAEQDVNCISDNTWKGMVVDVWDTYNGVSPSSIGREFAQLSVSFDPNMDEISMYMDGELLATSSYTRVFGVNAKKQTPNIPSIVPDNAFEYREGKVDSNSADTVKAGPKLDDYFTPWILGGGYTDGNPDGGFMGGEWGGRISGLKGYLGCTKFYSKALSRDEIAQNYLATKNFFKNIEVPNLMWEPINIS